MRRMLRAFLRVGACTRTCMQPLCGVASSMGIQAVTCSTRQDSGCRYALSCSKQVRLRPLRHSRMPECKHTHTWQASACGGSRLGTCTTWKHLCLAYAAGPATQQGPMGDVMSGDDIRISASTWCQGTVACSCCGVLARRFHTGWPATSPVQFNILAASWAVTC